VDQGDQGDGSQDRLSVERRASANLVAGCGFGAGALYGTTQPPNQYVQASGNLTLFRFGRNETRFPKFYNVFENPSWTNKSGGRSP
jgi:hypothetical protein